MSRKHLEAKKRHHYVWANYLARWGRGTKNVFYTTKTGKIASQTPPAQFGQCISWDFNGSAVARVAPKFAGYWPAVARISLWTPAESCASAYGPALH